MNAAFRAARLAVPDEEGADSDKKHPEGDRVPDRNE
jgi:hypothetical protein